MGDRDATHAIVPDVVGVPFHVGRDVAHRARVALANPDPDGPPIASLAWPGPYVIVRQHPAPGSTIREWGSVAVEVSKDGDAYDPVAASPRHPSPTDARAAAAEPEPRVDLDGALRSAPPDGDAGAPTDAALDT